MKKVLILTLVMISICYIVVIIFLKEEKIEIKKNNKKINETKDIVVRLKRVNKGIIENINLEEYVLRVISSEMPVSFHEEALKAQAVAARTYVLKKMENNKEKDFDVVDTVNDQVYNDDSYLKKKWKENYNQYMEKIKNVVKETSFEYLSYNNEIINAFFFSTSSGKTENSVDVFSYSEPYLVSVDSNWDIASPSYKTNYEFTLSDFYRLLNIPYNSLFKLEIIDKTSTGYMKTVSINGVIFKSTSLREKLNLKSSCFSLKKIDDKIFIETKGYGHGVGMSQYGANGMAKAGYDYKKILSHYYQNTKIKKLKN